MRKPLIAVLLVVLVAGLWSAAWAWAAHEAGRQLDFWLQAEAAQGRAWTCPSRKVGGYPFALAIDCADPSFRAQANGEGVEAQVAHLQAALSLRHPRTVALTLTPPFSYRTADATTNLGGTWSALSLDLEGLPNVQALSLHGSKLAVAGTFGAQGRQSGSAARLDADLTLPDDPAAPVVGFDIALAGAPIAALDQFLGGDAPADLALTGTLDHADVGDARTPAQAIETWREAGGQVTLASGTLSREAAKLIASGLVGLDAQHRPQGRLDAQFVGLEPILARYGINGSLAAAGSLLSALFGGGKPIAPAVPGALSLPITLRNGRVGIGPITTGIVLPPLY